ncbi:hypothetical protein GGS21DRAFT_527275 [Xylaria nigripes]|nr:hypothetical protein GGS21DRAFT_527275 [Xylaria nigripes]
MKQPMPLCFLIGDPSCWVWGLSWRSFFLLISFAQNLLVYHLHTTMYVECSSVPECNMRMFDPLVTAVGEGKGIEKE